MSVPLPTSGKVPYGPNYWSEIKESLRKLSENPSEELLTKTILKYLNQTKLRGDQYIANCPDANEIPNHDKLKTLSTIIQKEDADILSQVIPKICSIALAMPELFPSNHLKILEQCKTDSIELNRVQIACLVIHMFFCTFLPCPEMRYNYEGHFVGDASPTGPITFQYWLTSYMKPTCLYVKSIINYFKELSSSNLEEMKSQMIIFSRKSFEDAEVEIPPVWEQSDKQLVKVIPNLHGRIGDQESHVEMDFANKNVGFGTTGTQEELILGVSPESCPLVLFNETLKEKEAVLFQGIKRFANFQGYGFHVEYIGQSQDRQDWSKRKILALDALCYVGDERVQLRSQHLRRELNKAYCGFSMVPGKVVDSGHWGCGAFGGNKALKSMLQIMAASEANLDALEFFSFDEESFHKLFEETITILCKKKVTVGKLWDYIKKYERSGSVNDDDYGFLKFLKLSVK